MAPSDRIPLVEDNTTLAAPQHTPEDKTGMNPQPSLKIATELLYTSNRIATLRSSYKDRRRYVYCNSQQIFDALVNLYTMLFTTQWQVFRRFMDSFQQPMNETQAHYLARHYISMWFQDTYTLTRAALYKLSIVALNDRFPEELPQVGYEYDAYLSLLSASFRPTLTKHMMEDTLWIPCFSRRPNFHVESPFGINGYIINDAVFFGALNIMKERKQWKITDLPTNVIGRPCWLFDWHTDDRVCSWLPLEGNFNLDDVTLAYILGVACTPKLAPCDIDEWQPFPNNVIPANLNPEVYNRVTERHFHGGYEVRTLDIDNPNVPPPPNTPEYRAHQRRRINEQGDYQVNAPQQQQHPAGNEPAGMQLGQQADAQIQPVHRPKFRIIDWTYHYLVVLKKEDHTRFGALKSICWT